MNIVFSSLTCIPIYYTGKRIGGAGLAAGAAWLWAIFPNAIQLSFQSLWDTSLSALLGATALWATLRLERSNLSRDWTAYGLLWGVILMTNAAMLSMLPFFLAWLVYRNRANLRNAAIACAAVVLCCIPWTVRNYVAFGSIVPLRSTLGLQLWVGNNPAARPIWLGDHHPINDRAEREQYISMGEIPYMSAKRRDAVSYMLAHPAHEAALMAGRFTMFWSGGSPRPITDFLSNHSWWFRFVLAFNIAAAIGTLAGIFILFRNRSGYAFPLAAGPVVFPFAYYLTLALPRYRHPIDPVLMLLTAVSIAQTAKRLVRGHL
jgi:4-amino-4-deoxy-L-arabinose transferase-like glycosyltransferase